MCVLSSPHAPGSMHENSHVHVPTYQLGNGSSFCHNASMVMTMASEKKMTGQVMLSMDELLCTYSMITFKVLSYGAGSRWVRNCNKNARSRATVLRVLSHKQTRDRTGLRVP